MKAVRMIVVLLLFTAICSYAQFSADDVKTFTLDNGMKFLVVEEHTIPNVNFYIFFKVGSRNEYPGITGISHFFEHMMFNGAKKYGKGEFDRVQESGGGSNNAYTSNNLTVYTSWVPTDFLENQFDLEADRIADLAFIDEVVESERGVIVSERMTRLENSNYSFLGEQVQLTSMSVHPYRWSVIGYESDILNWKKEDLIKYHRTYYAPNNALTVIVGDVKLDEVKRLAEKYFGPIPGQPAPRKVHTIEPPQLGEKRLQLHKKVSTPNVMIAWHGPETSNADTPALSLLNTILSRGKTSRLYKTLVSDKQLAVGVNLGIGMNFDPNTINLFAIAAPGVDELVLEKAIDAIFDDVKANGVTERELEKAKNQLRMGLYSSLTTGASKANALGTYEIFHGGYEKMFNMADTYGAVSLEDIQAVAKKYYVKKQRTVGVLKDLGEEK
jgi:zinc protease